MNWKRPLALSTAALTLGTALAACGNTAETAESTAETAEVLFAQGIALGGLALGQADGFCLSGKSVDAVYLRFFHGVVSFCKNSVSIIHAF